MSEEERHSGGLEQLEAALDSQTKTVNIRLREGEHQFSLAKAIAASELQLHFPNAKELVRELYGEERTGDQRFLNMIQTILKKMEKSGVIRILPKKKPWELQRYALSSFAFEDVEKSTVILATEDEKEKTRRMLSSQPASEVAITQHSRIPPQVLLISLITLSFVLIAWAIAQSPISLPVFTSAFCLATASAVILGILVARHR